MLSKVPLHSLSDVMALGLGNPSVIAHHGYSGMNQVHTCTEDLMRRSRVVCYYAFPLTVDGCQFTVRFLTGRAWQSIFAPDMIGSMLQT